MKPLHKDGPYLDYLMRAPKEMQEARRAMADTQLWVFCLPAFVRAKISENLWAPNKIPEGGSPMRYAKLYESESRRFHMRQRYCKNQVTLFYRKKEADEASKIIQA